MDTIELRCQAEFCLRLLQLRTDRSLAGHLSFLAARDHESTLRAELGVGSDLARNQRAAEAFGISALVS